METKLTQFVPLQERIKELEKQVLTIFEDTRDRCAMICDSEIRTATSKTELAQSNMAKLLYKYINELQPLD